MQDVNFSTPLVSCRILTMHMPSLGEERIHSFLSLLSKFFLCPKLSLLLLPHNKSP